METKIGMDQKEFIAQFGLVVWDYDSEEDFLEFELEGVQKLWSNLQEKNYYVHNVHCVPIQSVIDIEPEDDEDLEVFYDDNEKEFFVINGETYFLDDFMADTYNNMWDAYETTSVWSADLIIVQSKEWLFDVDIDNSVIFISVSW